MKKIFSVLAIFAVLGIVYTTSLYAAGPYTYTTVGAGEWSTGGAGVWGISTPGGGTPPPTSSDTANLNNNVHISDGSTTDTASTTTINLTGTPSGGLIWFSGSGGTLTSNINDNGDHSYQAIEIDSGVTATINGNINLTSGNYILFTGGAGGGSTLNFSGTTLNAGFLVNNPGILNFTNAGGATVNQSSMGGTFGTIGINTTGTVGYTGTIVATDVNFGSAGTLSMAAGSGITGSVTTSSAGTGNLTLNGASTITGSVGIGGTGIGTISAGAAGIDEFQGAVNATNLNMAAGGGTVKLDVTSNITTTAFGATSDVLQFAPGVNLTGNITTTNTATLDTLGATTINGTISGTGGLTKTDIGTLTLTGNDSYSGATSITGGVLKFSAANNLGNASATNTIGISGGGILESTAAGQTLVANQAITVGAGGGIIQSDTGLLTVNGTVGNGGNLLTVAGAGNTTIAGLISGAGGLTKAGAGTLILSDASNSYSGANTITGGVLQFSAAGDLGNASATNTIGISGGGILESTAAGQTLVANQAITVGAGGGIIQSDTGLLTVNGTVGNGGNLLTVAGAGNTTIAGLISGAGGLTTTGTSTLYLASANTYTGATTINGGTLIFAPNSLQDTSSINFNNGGTLEEALSGDTLTQTITISGTGGVTIDSNSDGTPLTLSGPVVINGSNLLTVNFGNTTISGNISGSGGLTSSTFFGSTGYTLRLSGANTYTGATSITAGILQLDAAGALGDGTHNTSGVTVSSGAALDLGGITPTAGVALSLNGSEAAAVGALTNSNFSTPVTYGGVVTLGAGGASIGGAGDITLSSGLVTGGNALTKVGADTLILNGLSTGAGTTAINVGTVQVGHDEALGTGGITVASGAALDLHSTNYSTATALSIDGTGVGATGALTNSGGSTATYAGVVTLEQTERTSAAGQGIILLFQRVCLPTLMH